jgi:lipopolysaccharide export system permease protein
LNTLDRYIIRTILSFVLLCLIVLLALGALFEFISQQGDIGVGTYSTTAAMWYTLLNVPQQVYALLPITALLGSLLGMGSLARGSELTVIRATGISVGRIALTASLAACILIGLDVILGELIAPQLQQAAREHKAFLKYTNISFGSGGTGAWVRDGNVILNVTAQSGRRQFGGMQIFELSADHRLLAVGRAGKAIAESDHKWLLGEYVESRFADDSVQARPLGERVLHSNVTAGFLGLAVQDPELLTSAGLLELINYFHLNSLDARQYVFAFWSRIARTAAILFSVLLAIPFVLGSLRTAGAGTRTMMGLILGISIFLFQRVIETGTFVFNLNPVLLAWLPTTLLALVTMTLLYRAMRGGMIG